MGIPIISIGNIVIGGSGKTPFAIFLANFFKEYKPAVILRGYKRKSTGLVVVSKWGEVLVDVEISGDEAQEIATSTKALVIVSEDRKEGIKKAKEMGAGFVILDDGFDKPFKKLNIVLTKKIKNPFCLPAGGYRYSKYFLKFADIIITDEIKREVKIPKGDILITAISSPERLLKYWQKEYKFFPDHYDFKWEDLEEFKDKIIVCTKKDYVKLKKFPLRLKVIELKLYVKKDILDKIKRYLIKFHKKG